MVPIIPPAPIESILLWKIAMAGGITVIIATVMLLWGRILHRVFLVGLGAFLGYWWGGSLGYRIGISPQIVRIISMVVLGGAGLVFARVLWGLLGAILTTGVALLMVFPRYLAAVEQRPFPIFAPTQTLSEWVPETIRYLRVILEIECEYHTVAFIAVAGIACALPLTVLVIRKRLGVILMSSVLSGISIVAAVVTVLGRFRLSFWVTTWKFWYVPAVMGGVVTIAGLIFQYRGAIAAEKSEKQREGEPPHKDETKSSQHADKR